MLANLFFLIGRLPLSLLHTMGAGLGRFAYAISGSYRGRLDNTFAQASSHAGWDAKTIKREAIRHAGRAMTELPWLWLRPSSETTALVTRKGWEHVQAARAAGRGIVFLTPHLGCFEITAQTLALEGPITVLYSPPRQPTARAIVDRARNRTNLLAAPATLGGVRQLARALKRGEMVGILPDQVPGAGDGAWAPFFGRMAYTMTLPGRLQQLTNAVVVLCYGERLPDAKGYVMHVEPLDEVLSVDGPTQARQLNAAMERLIAQCPAQYLWAYNRYKQPAGAPAAPSVAEAD